DIDALKRHRVRVQYYDDDALHDKWCVYDCLVWEVTDANRRFVLLDGRWFEIAPHYAATVSEYVASIASDDINFPDSAEGQSEGEYNTAVAADDGENFALLDREPFVPTEAATQIEFCDLFSAAGHL